MPDNHVWPIAAMLSSYDVDTGTATEVLLDGTALRIKAMVPLSALG